MLGGQAFWEGMKILWWCNYGWSDTAVALAWSLFKHPKSYRCKKIFVDIVVLAHVDSANFIWNCLMAANSQQREVEINIEKLEFPYMLLCFVIVSAVWSKQTKPRAKVKSQKLNAVNLMFFKTTVAAEAAVSQKQ